MLFNAAEITVYSNSLTQNFIVFDFQEVTSSAGELLLSLSYLPAANRLGVVVMKARGLLSDKLKDNIGIAT